MFARDLTESSREILRSHIRSEYRKNPDFFLIGFVTEIIFLKIRGQCAGMISEGWGVGFQSSGIWDFNIFKVLLRTLSARKWVHDGALLIIKAPN